MVVPNLFTSEKILFLQLIIPVLVNKRIATALYYWPIIVSWHGRDFRITGPLWGNPRVTVGSPHKGPSTQSFDIFCCFRPQQTVKQTARLLMFETPWRSFDIIAMQCWLRILSLHREVTSLVFSWGFYLSARGRLYLHTCRLLILSAVQSHSNYITYLVFYHWILIS